MVVAILTTRIKDRHQIHAVWSIVFALLFFLGIMVASAFVNNAGLVNVIINFLMLGEPFMFLLAIACVDFSIESLNKFRSWLIISALINLLLAIIQKFLLVAGRISAAPYDETDGVQGVFFISGAGGYISASVSVSVSIYCLLYLKTVPLWIRILAIIGTIYQIQIADTKQVILVSGLAWFAIALTKVQDINKFLIYATSIGLAIAAFWWAIHNLELFEVYAQWLTRDDINNSDSGGGLDVKIEGIRRVLSYYRSPLNWLLGLGPGHTLGRLGGWTISDMWSILSRLGATKHPLYDEMWSFINSNWIALSSTLYVPLFTWAGVWGDQGCLGVAAYLYLGFLVWKYFCIDDFCKFLILTVFIYGFFLTQVEEPGFMLSTVILIGLRWHEHRMHLGIRQKSQRKSILLPKLDK
ncbi:hypothetical protein [Calothrix sp. UHCC 0171]|uniref:hypothetical protein n=1 Tax=Calothrix sp. UHCC 0171 TaxID=3110245 RepID=UPI002B1FBEEE|nr:hypothetical protein [Calothrix sp. UHCC 0171]MEA5573563.1 hypothetical protein [Calothrix sp. UHCC 0171]